MCTGEEGKPRKLRAESNWPWSMTVSYSFFLDYLFIYFQREGKGVRKRGRKMCQRYIYRLPLACPQLGTWPATPGMCLDWESTSDVLIHRWALNPLSHSSQGCVSVFRHLSQLLQIPCFTDGDCWNLINRATRSLGRKRKVKQSLENFLCNPKLETKQSYFFLWLNVQLGVKRLEVQGMLGSQ